MLRRRLMLRIRAFEEQAIRAADEKLVLGAIHPSVGQEAVAAGVCAPLRRDDLLLSTHRGHGHTLAKGADAIGMMRELFGRAGGVCGGKGPRSQSKGSRSSGCHSWRHWCWGWGWCRCRCRCLCNIGTGYCGCSARQGEEHQHCAEDKRRLGWVQGTGGYCGRGRSCHKGWVRCAAGVQAAC